MVIVETSIFTRTVQKLLSDDEYRQLQFALAERPDMGAIITGTGGLRKVRWSIQGRENGAEYGPFTIGLLNKIGY